jgi:hypothetical protein
MIDRTLEAVVGYGDLLEVRLSGADAFVARGHGPLLYLAPPAIVLRQSGSLLVIGITPDEIQVPLELQRVVRHRGHVRFTDAGQQQEAVDLLHMLGYRERSEAEWLKSPPVSRAEELIQVWNNRLDAAVSSGEILDLVVLNPEKPVRFYLGRWSSPQRLTGRFVGRRPQRYGADLWCYVELDDGQPKRFVDIPYGASPWRGCDDGWHLQAALDANRGKHQVATISESEKGSPLLRLYAPVPTWTQRRWDAVGIPVKAQHCLLAYEFGSAEIDEEIAYLEQHLWTLTINHR